MASADCLNKCLLGGYEFAAIVFDARKEPGATAFHHDSVIFGQGLGVLFQPFNAKQLLTDRLFVSGV